MAASFCGSTPSATVKQCSGKDNHDRLMALYHTGTDVKRHLLQYYLSQNKLDLAGFLYGKYQLLPPDYLKRALPTKNFQLLDLGIYTIDALLSDQCFDLFWDSCLDKVETSLENILNRYKEILYRLYKTSGRDNQSARNERKWDFLSKKQWEYLYNSPELQEMQENDFDLSLTFPNEGITTQSFDNDMNFVLLSNLCPLYQSLQVVTTNQMKLSMIAVEHEINNEAFDEIWKLMATHLKQISSYCIGEAWYDHNLNWIKEGSFKGVKAQESRKCILESTFDNKTFLEDAEFMTRVQEELNLIKAEETKDLVSKLCDREIPVLLVKGQYEAGSYPSAIEKAARQDLESCQSVCSKQATIMETVSTSKNINVLEEQKNIDRQSYLRFVNLIQEVAKAVLVEVLKKRFPGANFGNALNGMKTRLLPFLNGYQEQLLYPDGSKYAGDLSEMDISLLYIILRNHGTIGPHQKGWGKDPEEHDNSVSANIDRIRIAKNIIVSHSSNCLLGHAEFNKRWTEIRQCCVELGGEKYEEIIDNLLTSSFNSDLEQQFAKKLENLKEMDMCNEKHCRQREELLDSVKEILVILKKEQACRERSRDTNHEEGFTPMILQIKGNNIPGKKEIEEKIGNYNNNEMHVTSVDSGSIIIRLQMSSSAFQSFGYFLTAIDKLLQQAFSSRPISEDDIVVCISLSVNMHQFTEENTERSSRKENIFDQSTDVPPNAPMVTDQKSSSTSLLYGRSGMISKPESSVELVRTTREIPLRENNPVLALRPQLFQRFKEHNEVDKAKPVDLNDNQKRWLVVGICLHSVISPALMKYVVPILTELYNELTLKLKIDTQTYSTYLKQYPPTKAFLNYEAVNNNKATYGYRRAKYDYTIKSVVDLSKLFLQTHMAQYTGFDETCDSSTLLGLIINLDKFPLVVKADAEDVRRNIRIQWAHCDFTEWDAVKYSNSFQLMEKLMKDINLSSTEERKIVQKMEKLKLNGQHLLSGTTLGLELVNDIHHQTQALAEYTSMRINHVLENFDILLNTASGLEKEMKTECLERNMQSAYVYLRRKLQYFYKTLEEHCKQVPNDARQLRYCRYITKFASYFGKEWCMVAGSTAEGTRLRSNINEGDFDYLIISGISIPVDALEHREDLPCFVHVRGDKIQHSFSHSLVDGKYLQSRILKEIDGEAFKIMKGLFKVFTKPFDSSGNHSHDVDFNREAKPGMCKEHYVGFQLVDKDADNLYMRQPETDIEATNNYFQSVMTSSDLSPSMKSLLTNILGILAEIYPNDDSSTAIGQTFGGLIEAAISDSAIAKSTSAQPKKSKQSIGENDRNYIEDSSGKKVFRVKFNYKSSTDFIAAFPLEGKLECLEEWRVRILTSNNVLWPSSETVERICQSEVYVVAKPAIVNPSADIDYCLGFNQAELILASSLSSDQRLCVLLLKALQKGYLKHYSSVLTSYHWKTAFYYQCGQIDPALFDRHSTILLALESMLSYMIECLERKYLKHYFIESNLIAHITEKEGNEIRQNIKEIIKDPEAALQVYFDMNKECERSKQEEEISLKEIEEIKKRRNDPSNKKPADNLISMMADLQKVETSKDSILTQAIVDTLYMVIAEETDIPFIRPNTPQEHDSIDDLMAHGSKYLTTNFRSQKEKKKVEEDLMAKAFATVLSEFRFK